MGCNLYIAIFEIMINNKKNVSETHVYLHIFVIQTCTTYNRVIIVHYCLHLLFVYRFHAEIAQLFWSDDHRLSGLNPALLPPY